jgi:hypothetical protein
LIAATVWRDLLGGVGAFPFHKAFNAIVDGKDVTVRLDFPPDGKGTLDLKDYNWSSPGYQVPFLQQKVIEEFQAQIRKYQAIHPPVRLQFSQQPPSWVEQAIEKAGGTYFVKLQGNHGLRPSGR